MEWRASSATFPSIPAGPNVPAVVAGCWETLASSNAALRYYVELSHHAQPATVHELIKMAEEGDRHANEALKKQARLIGRGLRTIVAALAPEIILVSGDITTTWPRFGPIVEEELASLMLAGSPPRLIPVDESDVARLRGAAALVLQRHSGQPRSRQASAPDRPDAASAVGVTSHPAPL